MLNIQLICVGGLKEVFWKSACDEYIKRMSGWAKIKITEIQEERLPENPSASELNAGLEKEAAKIEAKLKPSAYHFALCIEGRQENSEEFAKTLSDIMLTGYSAIDFVIGGSNGLSQSLKKKTERCFSMSKLTFPHMIARVLLLEQLYRGLCILNGIKYHK